MDDTQIREVLSPKQIADTLSSVAERKAGTGMDVGLRRFLGGSVFSVGLMLVLIPGSELFTGNVLMTVGFLSKRVRLLRILRNWLVVWIGNFAGAMLLAWVMNQTGQLVQDGVHLRARRSRRRLLTQC